MTRTWTIPAVVAAVLAFVSPVGCAAAPSRLPDRASAAATSPAAARPAFTVETVASGLDIPWAMTWVGQLMLFDERPGRVWSQRPGQAPQRVSLPLPSLLVNSEGGLLGIVADPRATENGYFYTCQSVADAGGAAKDIEVWKWRLSSDTTADKVAVLVKGMPIGYGRHNGCRLVFRSERMLYIGTGDAAQGKNPQNLKSLGGKVLRVRSDGTIPRSNPFYRKGGNARYVWSYGHRNVQGLVVRPGTNQLWSAEHGPDRDDEINLVTKGSNGGWNPVPGYNEAVPMTDRKLYPKATKARWKSGKPTVATSGATFLTGKRWGAWDGAMAVAMLKGQGILVFTVDSHSRLKKVATIVTDHGRIRSVHPGPDGSLYFTTSNGSTDGIYRVVPQG